MDQSPNVFSETQDGSYQKALQEDFNEHISLQQQYESSQYLIEQLEKELQMKALIISNHKN